MDSAFATASEASSAGPSKPLSGLRIFIAEDSWYLAADLRQILELAGATVAGIASNLAQAERLAKSLAYDAAVMDINLHDLRTTPLVLRMAEAGMKVVVISGYDVAPDVASKVHACLSKPTSAHALIAALLSVVPPASPQNH